MLIYKNNKEYLDKVKKLKQHVPSLALTTDIIVGFPGETEEDFNDTLKLVEEANFEGAYTFIYSPRKGTPAASYENQIPQDISKQRLFILNCPNPNSKVAIKKLLFIFSEL